jgi:hypothetical protein
MQRACGGMWRHVALLYCLAQYVGHKKVSREKTCHEEVLMSHSAITMQIFGVGVMI